MIKEEFALDAWKSSLRFITENGTDFIDQNGRVCRQVLNFVMEIKNPSKNITAPIELLSSFKTWKYPRLEEISNIMLSSSKSIDYAYSYGSRIFSFGEKIDQINNYIIPLLKQNQSTRRAYVSVWDPAEDATGKSDVPGLTALDFIINEGKLCMTGIIRSNDIFFGWPANVYQLSVLQEYICKKLDLPPGSLTVFSVSAHIFKDQFEFIEKIIKK